MDGLDLLKKEWKRESNFPKVTETEIYKMIHKKSSSIVKWIFIISILEILFWVGLSLIFSDENQKEIVQSYRLDVFMKVYGIIHWVILGGFVLVFYRNFKNISNMSSAKTLMSNILKVRKVVKYYVWYNIIGMFISIVIVTVSMLQYDQNITSLLNRASDSGTETGIWFGMILTIFVMTVIMLLLLWLFYRVIYGILLKRLYNNYKELEKMEI